MKHKLSILAFILTAIVLSTTGIDAKPKAKSADAYVKTVRAAYSEAINRSKDDYTPHMTCSAAHILPATGPQNVKFDFFYEIDGPDDVRDDVVISNVFLIRLSYNFAATKFYEEYLFDENDNLIFFFQSGDTYTDEYDKSEFRYYFKPDGSLVTATQKDFKAGKLLRETPLKGGGQLADEAPLNAKKYMAALRGLFLL